MSNNYLTKARLGEVADFLNETTEVSPKQKLQRCPFCGSASRLNKWSKRIGKACPHIYRTAQVECKKKSCGMKGPKFKGDNANEKAIRHWLGCNFDNSLKTLNGGGM